MKEAGNVDDVDLLLSNMSHHEKMILAAKVCSAIYTVVQSAEFLIQLCDAIANQVSSDYICLSMAFVFAESE